MESASTRLTVAHTADLDRTTLLAARALLEEVFVDDPLDEQDWEHSLGGVHALAYEGGELVGHASVVMRRTVHHGRALRCGYVEGVGVRADRRRHGHFATMMDALERVVARAYDLGALGATDEAAPLYAARGWARWQGTTSALTPAGVVRTPDADNYVYVLPGAVRLALTDDLACDWRDGDVW